MLARLTACFPPSFSPRAPRRPSRRPTTRRSHGMLLLRWLLVSGSFLLALEGKTWAAVVTDTDFSALSPTPARFPPQAH